MGSKIDIGTRVRRVRQERGLSQAALAERIPGGSQQAIDQLERGVVQRPRYLPELAKALGVSVEWLHTGVDANPPPADEIDVSRLKDVVLVLEQALEAAGFSLSHDNKAELIGVLYEISLRDETVSVETLRSTADAVVLFERRRLQSRR